MKKLIESFKRNAKRPERRLGLVTLLLGVVSGLVFYTVTQGQKVESSAFSFERGEQVYRSSQGSSVAHHANGLNYHAIVIGIDAYGEKESSGWNNLKTAVRDAEDVGNVLEQKYGFKVHRLINDAASLQQVVTTLDRELVKLGPSDAALVYFAGHGYFDEEYGEGYWVPQGTPYELDGRPARERWISNSLISEILEASKARHILVVADSCYSGSLFKRAEESTVPNAGLPYYAEAIQKPSRFLLTSGNLEPVLDTGDAHSIFAGQLLDYLAAPPQKIFSATELGLQLREQISGVASQRVRLESLDLAKHQGGEFVFSMKDEAWPEAQKLRNLSGAYSAAAPDMDLSRVLLLHRSGAEEAAEVTGAQLKAAQVEPVGREQLSIRLEQGFRRSQPGPDVADLIDSLEERVAQYKKTEGLEHYAKPRVVAWMGPSRDEDYRAEAMEVVYQFALDKALLDQKGFTVMARAEMSAIMDNLNLGSSFLSNPEARLELQKIMPAGVLLVAQLTGVAGDENLFVKVVDVETAETLGVLRGVRGATQDEFTVAESVVDEVVALLKEKRPLTAGLLEQSSATRWQVGVGQFHGAFEGMKFAVVQQIQTMDGAHGDFTRVEVGEACIETLSEMSSTALVTLHDGVEQVDPVTVKLIER